MTRREWIIAILKGDKTVPVAQQWMSFFNADTARKLTPSNCHYTPLGIYEVTDRFDCPSHGEKALDAMIRFNRYTGRCMTCLGPGANQAFGHGGPGEFLMRILEKSDNGMILQYETGVKTQVQYHPHFYHNFDYPIQSADDVDRLALPDPWDLKRYDGFARDCRYLKSRGEYVLGSLNGFYSGLHYFLMDYEKTLMALMAEPELIQKLLDKLGEWNLAAADTMLDAGVDCIALCDDLGSRENLMFSPRIYREFFKPWHFRLCYLAHARGRQVHFHSHGAITPLLDDLADCGFDFINPFDPEEGHDTEKVLQKYADRFVVVGGLPTSFWSWPFEKQRERIAHLNSLGQKYGRLIPMDSGGVPETVSPPAFKRLLDASRSIRHAEQFETTD
jgi:uroporphyrinogen decarboxylase